MQKIFILLCACVWFSVTAQENKVRKNNIIPPLGAYIYSFDGQGIDSTFAATARYTYDPTGKELFSVTTDISGVVDSIASFYNSDGRIDKREGYMSGMLYRTETWTYDLVNKNLNYLIDANLYGMSSKNRITYIGVKDFDAKGVSLALMGRDITLMPCDTIVMETYDDIQGIWNKNLDISLSYSNDSTLPSSGKLNIGAILDSLPFDLDSLPISSISDEIMLTFIYDANKDLTNMNGSINITIIIPGPLPIPLPLSNIDIMKVSYTYVNRNPTLIATQIGFELSSYFSYVYRTREVMTYNSDKILSRTSYIQDSLTKQFEKVQSMWYFYDLSVQDFEANNLSFHPNPATDYVKIQNIETPSQIYIHDITGRIVSKQSAVVGDTNLHVGNLPSGIYIIRLWNSQMERTAKLVIAR